MAHPIPLPVPLHVASDARERAVIAVLLTKIDEAIAFAEAVQGAAITYADYGLIEDHLASLDVTQLKITELSRLTKEGKRRIGSQPRTAVS